MKRFQALLMVAAAMVAGCDKADRTTSVFGGAITPPPAASATQTLRGTVVSNPAQEIEPRLALELEDGTTVGLIGAGATALTSVIGAEVEVVGSPPVDLITASLLEVQRFLVLSVGGTKVSDGMLEMTETGGYALNLIGGGYREIANPPEGLADHLGERVWVTLPDDDSPLAFGVIRADPQAAARKRHAPA